MNDHTNDKNRGGVAAWEDDGGAPRSERERLDASHQSDTRGEHRYGDIHQTGPEQAARQERDALKRRLAGRDTRHASRRAG